MMVKVMEYDRSCSWALWTDVTQFSMSRIKKYDYNIVDNIITHQDINLGDEGDYFILRKADELQNFNCECLSIREDFVCPKCGRSGKGFTFNFRSFYLTFKDGSKTTIINDTVVYLINDDGKTIDKVVVNPEVR